MTSKVMSSLVLAVTLAACGKSKPKPDFVRFIFNINAKEGVAVTVAGKPVTLEVRDDLRGLYGLIDFKASEVPVSTMPEITVPSPCGPKQLTKFRVDPPNESNVVMVEVSSADLPPKTTLLLSPSITEPVRFGQIELPAPLPRELDVYDAGCGEPLMIGVRSIPLPQERAAGLLVPAGPNECFLDGVALFGQGTSCEAPSSRQLTGQPIYALHDVPFLKFESPPMQAMATTDCQNWTYVVGC
jgi:hypothetical protein